MMLRFPLALIFIEFSGSFFAVNVANNSPVYVAKEDNYPLLRVHLFPPLFLLFAKSLNKQPLLYAQHCCVYSVTVKRSCRFGTGLCAVQNEASKFLNCYICIPQSFLHCANLLARSSKSALHKYADNKYNNFIILLLKNHTVTSSSHLRLSSVLVCGIV